MKFLIYFLLFFSCLATKAQNDATTDEVSVIKGVVYKNSRAFTGTLYQDASVANNTCMCILEAAYLHGYLNGVKNEYFASGKLKFTGSFSNGKEIGEHIFYDELGNIEMRITFTKEDVEGVKDENNAIESKKEGLPIIVSEIQLTEEDEKQSEVKFEPKTENPPVLVSQSNPTEQDETDIEVNPEGSFNKSAKIANIKSSETGPKINPETNNFTDNVNISVSEINDFVPAYFSEMTDVPPTAPGCEGLSEMPLANCTINEIYTFIQYNIDKKTLGLQGLPRGKHHVLVKFQISRKGTIRDISVQTPLIQIENEFIRVLKSLPTFRPGKLNGELVRVKYEFGLNVTLD